MTTTTTVILGRPRSRGRTPALLVDPAWDADELVAIGDDLDELELQVVAGFATHAHHDHLLWHPRYGLDVVRWASGETARVARESRAGLMDALTEEGAAYPSDVLALFGRVTALPAEAPGIPDPDRCLPATEVVVHDGHAPGHSALWLPDAGVLVAGDMLSDVEIPLPFDPDDLPAYLAGLDRLAPYVARARLLVPGHGTPTSSPGERLDADRRYLDAVLAGRRVDDPRLANPGMRAEHEHLLRMVDHGS